MAQSYNGWTASRDPAEIGIDRSWSVLGSKPFKDGGFAGGVKSGPVATIFRYLVTRLHNEVEPIDRGPNGEVGYGCWAYEYRVNVNNPAVLSCHASGTAIDYNAHLHRNGTVAPNAGSGWTANQYEKIRGIIADLGGVVRWLWSNDPMHFEIIGTPAQCEAVAARLGTPTQPPTNPTDPEDDMPYSEQEVKEMVYGALQWFFQDAAAKLDLPVLRGQIQAAVNEAVPAAVKAEVAKLLPTAVQANKDQRQATVEMSYDGAKWALEDPNVDVSRFPGAATKS